MSLILVSQTREDHGLDMSNDAPLVLLIGFIFYVILMILVYVAHIYQLRRKHVN